MRELSVEHFKEHVEYIMRDPILFGDYRTALEETEPRIYEDLQDYEAAKALFQEASVCVCVCARVCVCACM